MRIVFATNNQNKLEEVKFALGNKIEIISLKEIDFFEDIPEPHETIEENAREKSFFISKRYNINCFADDTGLEIEALNGEPGVYSARYAGENCSFKDNTDKVLRLMKGKTNRKARFRTVISLVLDSKEYQFEGVMEGEITTSASGDKGFGYDPIFKPEGFNKTFAEMSMTEKNKISHRGKAVAKLIDFLKSL